jgi:pimeloyl-ACP methyl ester carboxylesterase
MAAGPTSEFVSAADGLRLHARCWGRRSASSLPVVCLPGLSRTAADFDALASVLVQDTARPRWVIALDYRGRGESEYDRDPANYNLQVELGDLLAVLTALDALPAIFIGTSRGGILIMLLALARPSAIAAAVLNDIGPVIEPQGLMRIKGYVGKLPQPRDFADAGEMLRRLFDTQFPKLTADDWLAAAHRAYKERNGALVPTYDVKLAKTMQGVNFEKPPPPLWKEFDALGAAPLMVIRGANSDILSGATVEAMCARRKQIETLEVPDQGHAPVLAEADTIARIGEFITACDSNA